VLSYSVFLVNAMILAVLYMFCRCPGLPFPVYIVQCLVLMGSDTPRDDPASNTVHCGLL